MSMFYKSRCSFLICLFVVNVVNDQPLSILRSPPTMVKQPPREQLYKVAGIADKKIEPIAILECEAEGSPKPRYHWLKNGLEFDYTAYGKRIIQQEGQGTLFFMKLEDFDEGLYQCFASNWQGMSISNTVFLRKSELNSFSDVGISIQSVLEGYPLTLECQPPKGYPTPVVFWIKQFEQGHFWTSNSSRITVDPKGNLHFSNITLEDGFKDAAYACTAVSQLQQDYKIGKKIILEVKPRRGIGQNIHPPVMQYVPPPKVVALCGEKLELSCIFGGTPLPETKWNKINDTLTSRHTFINYGKTLEVRKVDFEDAGVYECVGSNGIGSPLTYVVDIEVQSKPVWVVSPHNVIVPEGGRIKFVCEAKAFPEPELRWFINGQPIERFPNPRRKVEGSVMVMDNLNVSDTAVYQCNASNVHGYVFKDFYLNVLEPILLNIGSVPLTRTVVGSSAILRCPVFGVPTPNVKWVKNYQEFCKERCRILGNGDLEILKVLLADHGTYVCIANNTFGILNIEYELEVKEKTNITQSPENFEVAIGESATFQCSAEANPTLDLKIYWFFNGQLIDMNQDSRIIQASNNSLTIDEILKSDTGRYTCVAHTELDEDRAEAILTVQDVPDPPRITEVWCDNLVALVKWKPMGDGHSPILSYSVQYNTSFTPDIWVDFYSNITASDTCFKVKMSPWANYSFRIIAKNKIGSSEPSELSEHCTTPEAVPDKNPELVVGRGTEPESLVISWLPMPLIEQNAPGFFYKVFWKRVDNYSNWQHANISEWETNHLVIRNQSTFQEYHIKVEAHNRRGQALVSAEEVQGHSEGVVVIASSENIATAGWFIGMFSALVLFFVFCALTWLNKRRRNGEYFVYKQKLGQRQTLGFPSIFRFREYKKSARTHGSHQKQACNMVDFGEIEGEFVEEERLVQFGTSVGCQPFSNRQPLVSSNVGSRGNDKNGRQGGDGHSGQEGDGNSCQEGDGNSNQGSDRNNDQKDDGNSGQDGDRYSSQGGGKNTDQEGNGNSDQGEDVDNNQASDVNSNQEEDVDNNQASDVNSDHRSVNIDKEGDGNSNQESDGNSHQESDKNSSQCSVTDSVGEYCEAEVVNFDEDGSFIGQYISEQSSSSCFLKISL